MKLAKKYRRRRVRRAQRRKAAAMLQRVARTWLNEPGVLHGKTAGRSCEEHGSAAQNETVCDSEGEDTRACGSARQGDWSEWDPWETVSEEKGAKEPPDKPGEEPYDRHKEHGSAAEEKKRTEEPPGEPGERWEGHSWGQGTDDNKAEAHGSVRGVSWPGRGHDVKHVVNGGEPHDKRDVGCAYWKPEQGTDDETVHQVVAVDSWRPDRDVQSKKGREEPDEPSESWAKWRNALKAHLGIEDRDVQLETAGTNELTSSLGLSAHAWTTPRHAWARECVGGRRFTAHLATRGGAKLADLALTRLTSVTGLRARGRASRLGTRGTGVNTPVTVRSWASVADPGGKAARGSDNQLGWHWPELGIRPRGDGAGTKGVQVEVASKM